MIAVAKSLFVEEPVVGTKGLFSVAIPLRSASCVVAPATKDSIADGGSISGDLFGWRAPFCSALFFSLTAAALFPDGYCGLDVVRVRGHDFEGHIRACRHAGGNRHIQLVETRQLRSQ